MVVPMILHLVGGGASRHFTYRAVQALKQIVPNKSKVQSPPLPINHGGRIRDVSAAKSRGLFDHTRCPQAEYQREIQRGNRARHYVSYASVVRNNGQIRGEQLYSSSIPTKNRFDVLSMNTQGNW